jgi:hypothetical protein
VATICCRRLISEGSVGVSLLLRAMGALLPLLFQVGQVGQTLTVLESPSRASIA